MYSTWVPIRPQTAAAVFLSFEDACAVAVAGEGAVAFMIFLFRCGCGCGFKSPSKIFEHVDGVEVNITFPYNLF